MDVRFLLGPAGSGKTYRCLAEIRSLLLEDPLGPPLILLAPRQATYQLELQLLSDPALSGYTRLQIVSFERFSTWLLDQYDEPPYQVLSEEGRTMVLRALLHEHHGKLTTFAESGRSAGFARLLSDQLREVQQHRIGPARLRSAADRLTDAGSLGDKLRDLALVLEEYQAWLGERAVPDAGTLLDRVVERLGTGSTGTECPIRIAGLWLDGVAELTPQEMELIAALAPCCEQATLAFCLETVPKGDVPWLSNWSVISQTFRRAHARFAAIPECTVRVELIGRGDHPSRFMGSGKAGDEEYSWPVPGDVQLDLFGAPRTGEGGATTSRSAEILNHLESAWTSNAALPASAEDVARELSLVRCAGPEQEAVMTAREVLRFVQAGNRFRDCAVLLRRLDTHAAGLRRVFTRYEIPFFMDQRESVAHHPLAELTRSALHTVLYRWKMSDWFGALKSGLTNLGAEEVDRLETFALAHGWEGARWWQPLTMVDDPEPARECEQYRQRVIGPFEAFRDAILDSPSGRQLAEALRVLWAEFDVETRLQEWANDSAGNGSPANATHLTVLEEMQSWLENLELAFSNFAMPLRDWLPILETGLSGLTVGVIPPAVDQVLVGAVDRSRNPDLKLAMVLGLNEGVFPGATGESLLLTDGDRSQLEGTDVQLRWDQRMQLGHERYLGYIAFTRARQRLVLSWSEHDGAGKPLNRSPLIDHVTRLFPNIRVEAFEDRLEIDECVHPREILAPLLRVREDAGATEDLQTIEALASVKGWLNHFSSVEENFRQSRLSRESTDQLHGARLKTSASRLEQFAACPFQYFVNAGLRAKERLRFEVDARKTGTFMHEVLRQFHEELDRESLKWRSVAPADARERIARIATEQRVRVAHGVLDQDPRSVFLTGSMTELLQDFVEQAIRWMSSYQFDPVAVELSIGGEGSELPWWEIDLGEGRTLAFRGSVDRVDTAVDPETDDEICLNVLDYKSGYKKFDELKTRAGLQLQLPAYLAALCAVAPGSKLLGGRRPRPTGMFYVRLKDGNARSDTRIAADAKNKSKPFEHTGRFSFDFLSLFDSGYADGSSGQFTYRLKADGTPYANSREIVSQRELQRQIDGAESMLKVMGEEILNGNIAIDPFRRGSELPCDWCEYKSVCRIDPWTHSYRPLRPLLAGVNP